ncbi:hypothetical protein KIN20_016149 [Parelaphostrongylus tenuis]|uniref:Uncharacterized protein n=1 Tax=Parelaphostrongylus tenuis TaxID=148309 RepID=A0AAD5MG05_PARTN|nr:hypothetical protein KIN20_016149 [Parelaphostrongylus tenuis]
MQGSDKESGKSETKEEDTADHYGRLNALATFEGHGGLTSRFPRDCALLLLCYVVLIVTLRRMAVEVEGIFATSHVSAAVPTGGLI